MKKLIVDCHTGPRSRTRARSMSLISQRNSFSPFDARTLAFGATDATGPGFARATATADVVAARAFAVQFIGANYSSRAFATATRTAAGTFAGSGAAEGVSPSRVISTLPRSRAPSSMPMRGVSTLPSTWLLGPSRTLPLAFKLPCTVPLITMSRASMSAVTRPFGPTVTQPFVSRILPCVSPSMMRSDVPVISPRIFRPALIVDGPPFIRADTWAGDATTGTSGTAGVDGATATTGVALTLGDFIDAACGVSCNFIGAGAGVFEAGEDGLASLGLRHISVASQEEFRRILRRAGRHPDWCEL